MGVVGAWQRPQRIGNGRSPVWRATPEGLARNAAVVLGNLGDPAARRALADTAATHPSPLVREHAAWALAKIDRKT